MCTRAHEWQFAACVLCLMCVITIELVAQHYEPRTEQQMVHEETDGPNAIHVCESGKL